MVRIYIYKNCDTCRKALKFLQAHGVAFEEIPIRENPPSKAELEQMLRACGGELRRLFNTSGMDYRALNMKEKLPGLSVKDALELLSKNGNLVKRPFLAGPQKLLVGFDEAEWSRAFQRQETRPS